MIALVLLACTGDEIANHKADTASQRIYELDDALRITHGVVLGSHNSYHQQPETEAVAEWNYQHPPLSEQLDRGLRQFELDIHRHPDTGEFVVLHVPVLDAESSCDRFADCLQEIAEWSTQNPWHFPIQILIEPKTEFAGWSFFTEQDAWTEVEEIIRDAFDERLFTPEDLQKDHESLRDAVLIDGWPTLNVLRGKVLLALLDGGEPREHYTNGLTSVSGRTMFPLAPEGHELSAYFLRDDPYDERISSLVAQGFLVRTRGDAGLISDPNRLEQALLSGAHAISTDLEENHWWVEATHPISCNPVVDLSVCSPQDLE